ncbi:MAG: cell division protein ZapA [Spirochaetales bacterium]
MASFDFNRRKNEITLSVCGKDYSFDISPTNYDFVKKVAVLSREVEELSGRYNAMPKDSLADLEAAFDLILEKERQVIEVLLPGKWDELFDLAGHDLLAMVDLIGFITGEIKGAGVAAKVASVTPAVPDGPEV